jgi:hypothetical protein
MSTKILVENVRHRFNHNESKLYLKEKYTNKLSVVHGGGLWAITPQLIAFLREPTNDTQFEILIDSYGHPIKINRQELLTLAVNTYTTVMNEWYTEHQALGAQR